MRVLALETSSVHGSVAVLDHGKPVRQEHLRQDQRSAQSLAPAIDSLLNEVGWQPTDLDLVAVTSGPGSFTGLRVGLMTAKCLSYATQCAVVGVDTLEVIARQAQATLSDAPAAQTITSVLNAYRQQLFVATFETGPAELRRTTESHLEDQDRWLKNVPETILAGPVLAKLAAQLPEHATVADQDCWDPLAVTVGQIGCEQAQQGKQDDCWNLGPLYLRASAAEEKA